LERRIRTIQKWLERCLVSCKAKSWERAIADMECANAELRLTREELWLQASTPKEATSSRNIRNVGLAAKALLVASLILMVSAAPVAVNQGTLPRWANTSSKPVLEWLEKDEEMLITALRQSLSENGFRETDLSDTVVQERINEPAIERNVARLGRRSSDTDSGTLPMVKKETRRPEEELSGSMAPEVSVEEVLALLEIGQRVLRNPEPPITVEK